MMTLASTVRWCAREHHSDVGPTVPATSTACDDLGPTSCRCTTVYHLMVIAGGHTHPHEPLQTRPSNQARVAWAYRLR